MKTQIPKAKKERAKKTMKISTRNSTRNFRGLFWVLQGFQVNVNLNYFNLTSKYSFFNSPHFSDLTVKVDDTEFKVHKVILCSRSEYFSRLYKGGNWAVRCLFANSKSFIFNLSLEYVDSELILFI